MKRFFYIFLLFFGIFSSSFADVDAKTHVFHSDSSIEQNVLDVDSFYQMVSSDSALSPLIKTDFGSLQVMSADFGTDKTNTLFFALNVKIKKGQIVAPQITVVQKENINDVACFYPVFEFIPAKGLFYGKDVAFPLLMNISKSGKDVAFDVFFQAEWCENQDCVSKEYTVPMIVHAGKNYYSKYAAFIMNALRYIPVPATEDQIQIHTLNEDDFWIALTAEKRIKHQPEIMLLNDKNRFVDYTKKEMLFSQNKALFILKTAHLNQVKTVIVKVDDRLYQKQMNMSFQELPDFDIKTPSLCFLSFYIWIAFLLISPIWVLLCRLNIHNEIIARSKLKSNIIGIFCGIICMIAIYAFVSYIYLINSTVWLAFCCGLFIICAVSDRRICAFGYGILVGIVPYFSLLSGKHIDLNLLTQQDYMCFFIILALVNVLPLIILWMKPKYAVLLDQYSRSKASVLFKRLPFLMDALIFLLLLILKLSNL